MMYIQGSIQCGSSRQLVRVSFAQSRSHYGFTNFRLLLLVVVVVLVAVIGEYHPSFECKTTILERLLLTMKQNRRQSQRTGSVVTAFLITPVPLSDTFMIRKGSPWNNPTIQQYVLHFNKHHPTTGSRRLPIVTETKGRDDEYDDFLGSFDDDDDDDNGSADDDGDEENQTIGNNWVRPSKSTTDDDEDTDDNVVDFFFDDEITSGTTDNSEIPINFDVGINGRMMETGPLSLKMYNAIQSRNSLLWSDMDTNPTLRRTIYEVIVRSTAKEAVKVTLEQSGLQLVNDNDMDDTTGWGMIESIRIDTNPDAQSDGPMTFDSWDDLLLNNNDGNNEEIKENGWKPGQSFSFVLRNVPTYRKAVSMEELLSSIDPDGSLRNQALDAGIINEQDDDIDGDNDIDEDEEEYFPLTSLKELFEDNYRRVEKSPRTVDDVDTVYTGTNKGGYRIIHANDLLRMVDEINSRIDNNETITADIMKNFKNTTMQVMDALVSHGCLLIDVTDGNTNQSGANILYQMWQTTESFYRNVVNNVENQTALPLWETVTESGSVHAKVGYQSKLGSSTGSAMSVLETRQRFDDGQILPIETKALFGTDGYNTMLNAFHMITELCQATIQIAVAASTQEIGIVDATTAMIGARRLVNELVDTGKPLQREVPNRVNSYPVSNSPHRLLQYEGTPKDHVNDDAEIFGAHTDTTFITAVPVASVAGLEVYDEAAQLWYRPELALQQQHQEHCDNDTDNETIPWYARYVIFMPGELLQICTGNEIPAAVHRVIDGRYSQRRTTAGSNNNETSVPFSSSSSSVRYSAPILLRGRSGLKFDCDRYFGNSVSNSPSSQQPQPQLSTASFSTTITGMWPIWTECQQKTMDQIYSALQGRPNNTKSTS